MRTFIQYEPTSGRVIAEISSKEIPGDGPELPPNCVETTGRVDGPYVGKVYVKGSDSFSVAPENVKETGRKTSIATLEAKPAAAWTLEDVATWLKAKL